MEKSLSHTSKPLPFFISEEELKKEVYRIISQIPRGRVSTYLEVAKALGDPVAARWVGKALKENPHPIVVPCHRVVMSSGKIGGYSGGVEKKIELLVSEGVRVEGDRIVDLPKILFKEFSSSKPLKKLRKFQLEIASKAVFSDSFSNLKKAVAVDVAYKGREYSAGVVVYDLERKKVLDEIICKGRVEFPYIPGYLFFREGPIVMGSVRDLEFDLLLIDGNGLLHPVRAGLAVMVGVLLDVPTIGVAKSLLCGRVGERGEVVVDGEIRGFEVRREKKIYVSPGHRISLETSLKIIEKLPLIRGLPEPLKLAHNLSGRGFK